MTNTVSQDRPEYGKVYDLSAMFGGNKTWKDAEVKPETEEQIEEKRKKQEELRVKRAAQECEELRVIAELGLSTPEQLDPKNIYLNDIFVDSWGYDQTNIDYYQVVSISPSGKTARVKPIHSKIIELENSFMSNKVIPDKNNFEEDASSYKPAGNLRINKSSYGICLGSGRHSMTKWDGRPDTETHYA